MYKISMTLSHIHSLPLLFVLSLSTCSLLLSLISPLFSPSFSPLSSLSPLQYLSLSSSLSLHISPSCFSLSISLLLLFTYSPSPLHSLFISSSHSHSPLHSPTLHLPSPLIVSLSPFRSLSLENPVDMFPTLWLGK